MDLNTKRDEIAGRMVALGRRLEVGDESELIHWVLQGSLACAHRPLRHHLHFGGSRLPIPATATSLVRDWAARIRRAGIASIISLMHDRDLQCYEQLEIEGGDLLAFYEAQGFIVARIPWEDPHHKRTDEKVKQKMLEQCRTAALREFDRIPKPVLLQCSAGIDRSAPVAAYIWQNRSAV